MGDADKFTHEELVALLERSVTLQERAKERAYTTEDLVAAARELGIEPEVARGAANELLAKRRRRNAIRKPFDSRLELSTEGGVLRLVVPPLRVQPQHLGTIGFSLFWLGFIAFWTAGAARASFLFASFSVPFWLVGIAMLGRTALPLISTTVLELSSAGGRLARRPIGRAEAFPIGDLRVTTGASSAELRAPGMPGQALLLELGTRTLSVLHGYSEQELRWVESEVAEWLSLHRAEG